MCIPRLPLVLSVVAAAFILPNSAEGASVHTPLNRAIFYQGDAAETNRLDVVYGTRSVVLRELPPARPDSGDAATVREAEPGPCRIRPDGHSAICPIASVSALLGDGDDRAVLDGRVRRHVDLDGGTGDDVLTAMSAVRGPFAVALRGGLGDDQLNGSPGNDHLDGGGGTDRLEGRAGADGLDDGDGRLFLDMHGVERAPPTPVDSDRLDGGDGVADTVMYSRRLNRPGEARRPGVSVDLRRSDASQGEAGENDTLTGFENVWGSDGDDVLTGNAATNRLSGGRGDDTLTGNERADVLRGDSGVDGYAGGGGADRIEVLDDGPRASEAPACDIDLDVILGSLPGDLAPADCERVVPALPVSFIRSSAIEMRARPVAIEEDAGVVSFRLRCTPVRRFVGCRGALAVAPGSEGRADSSQATQPVHATRSFSLTPRRWSTVRLRLDAAGRAALLAAGESSFEVQVRRVRADSRRLTGAGGYTTRF